MANDQLDADFNCNKLFKEIKCSNNDYCLFTAFDTDTISYHIKNYHDPNKFKYCFFCGFCSKKDILIWNHNCSRARLREIEAERIYEFDKTVNASSFNTPGPSGINSFTPGRKVEKKVLKYRNVYSSDSESDSDSINQDFNVRRNEEPKRRFESSKIGKKSAKSITRHLLEDSYEYNSGISYSDDESDQDYGKNLNKKKKTGVTQNKSIKKNVKPSKSKRIYARPAANLFEKANTKIMTTKIMIRDDNNNLLDLNNKNQLKKPSSKEEFKKSEEVVSILEAELLKAHGSM